MSKKIIKKMFPILAAVITVASLICADDREVSAATAVEAIEDEDGALITDLPVITIEESDEPEMIFGSKDTGMADEEDDYDHDEIYGKNKLNISKSAYNTFEKIKGRGRSYIYKQLTKEEKKLYNRLDDTVNRYLYYGEKPSKKKIKKSNSSVSVTSAVSWGKLDQYAAEKVLFLYLDDNPQAFLLSSHYFYDYNKGNFNITLLPGANSPSKIKKKAEDIAKNLNSTADKVKKVSGDYKKAKKAQELICKMMTFDKVAWKEKDYTDANEWSNWVRGNYYFEESIISTFGDKKKYTNYMGYAKSYTAVARLAGLDTITVSGWEKSAYNKVKVKGKWYNLSTGYEKYSGKKCTYDYFLKSDSDITNKNNTLTPSWYYTNVIPKCKKNYK